MKETAAPAATAPEWDGRAVLKCGCGCGQVLNADWMVHDNMWEKQQRQQ
jgi:hypothetical protein